MTIKDGRQWATRVEQIRRDHVERYRWAAMRATGTVGDFACGIGYGANILANTGRVVIAYEKSAEALAFAREHWDHPKIEWLQADLDREKIAMAFHTAVAFEIIEHLKSPELLLSTMHATRLLCSVPNEAVMPFDPKRHSYHLRHFTKHQFGFLLSECGWTVREWFTQEGKHSPVTPGDNGMTLIADCRR